MLITYVDHCGLIHSTVFDFEEAEEFLDFAEIVGWRVVSVSMWEPIAVLCMVE
jgi:hypothetical protein